VPTEPQPITLFEIAKRAVEVADPADADERLGELLEQFEDADEPVTAIENLEERVAIAVEGVDVEIDDPAVSMAAATILYLARRRDEQQVEGDGQHGAAEAHPLDRGVADALKGERRDPERGGEAVGRMLVDQVARPGQDRAHRRNRGQHDCILAASDRPHLRRCQPALLLHALTDSVGIDVGRPEHQDGHGGHAG